MKKIEEKILKNIDKAIDLANKVNKEFEKGIKEMREVYKGKK